MVVIEIGTRRVKFSLNKHLLIGCQIDIFNFSIEFIHNCITKSISTLKRKTCVSKFQYL